MKRVSVLLLGIVLSIGSGVYALQKVPPSMLDVSSNVKTMLESANNDALRTSIAVNPLATIAALKAYSTAGLADGQILDITSYYVSATPDGGGGRFKWDAASTATDNGGTIIAPDAGGAGRWRALGMDEALYAKRFGVKFDAVSNDSTAWQAVITAAAGLPIIAEAGTTVVTTQLTHSVSAATKNAGLIIIGRGREKTFFDNRVANNAMIKIDTGVNNKFQWGGLLSGFTIKTTTSPAASDGIYIRRQQALTIEDVRITGLTGDGIEIELATGDADSTTGVTLRHSWIDLCAGWGIHSNLAAGLNELSYLKLENTRVESNGTTSAASPPPSGGMKWKGQILVLEEAAFVTNENIGLYVVGGAGASNQLLSVGSTFENNKKKSLLIQTLNNGMFVGTQFYNNDSFVATHGADLTTSGGSNNKISFHSTTVRITSGNNPFTAFTFDANCTDCVVTDTHWQQFDAAGQTRFSNSGVGTRVVDDGIAVFGSAVTTGAARGDVVIANDKGVRGVFGANTYPLVRLDTNADVVLGSSSTRTKNTTSPFHIETKATADLPAAAANENGRIIIEDAGAGDRNLIIYAGGQRFRIDGGAAF